MKCNTVQRLALVGALMFLAQPAFATFMDGTLAGQDGWEGQQPNWTVTDSANAGFATGTGNWARARTFNGSQAATDMTQGAQVDISATFNVTGPLNNGADFFRIGLGGAPEHTGNQTPQVSGNVSASGGNISSGGASVAYSAGETVRLDLTITRGTSAADWGLTTTLTNVTQSIVSGPSNSTPADLANNGPNPPAVTLHEHILNGENSLLAFRMLNNADGRTINIDSVSISGPSGSYSTSFNMPVPEPGAMILLLSGLVGGALIRR